MRYIIPLFLVVLGMSWAAPALARLDSRAPNDPSSIADEPKDPVDEPPPTVEAKPAVKAEPAPEPEPEITLESVVVTPLAQSKHAKDADVEAPEITLESVVVRPSSTARDLKKAKTWGNELALWLELRSHCGLEFEGSQKAIVAQIKDLSAEFRKISQTTLKIFRQLNGGRNNIVPELAVISGHLDDDLKMMAEPENFRGKGFETFMLRLDFDLKMARHNVDRSEHWTGVTQTENGVVVGHLDKDANDKLVKVNHRITDPGLAKVWSEYGKVLARFKDVELRALQSKINALKHAALCQTSEKKLASLFDHIAKESNQRNSLFSAESASVEQGNCPRPDKDVQSLLELRNQVGAALLNLDGIAHGSRVVVSAVIDSYLARHKIHGSLDHLSEKQREELFSLVRETLLRMPASK